MIDLDGFVLAFRGAKLKGTPEDQWMALFVFVVADRERNPVGLSFKHSRIVLSDGGMPKSLSILRGIREIGIRSSIADAIATLIK